MDLSKYPAPWTVKEIPGASAIVDGNGRIVFSNYNRDLAEQICLWRNAEDAQMRRGLIAVPQFLAFDAGKGTESCVKWGSRLSPMTIYDLGRLPGNDNFPFPSLAIVEADKWLTEQEGEHPSITVCF